MPAEDVSSAAADLIVGGLPTSNETLADELVGSLADDLARAVHVVPGESVTNPHEPIRPSESTLADAVFAEPATPVRTPQGEGAEEWPDEGPVGVEFPGPQPASTCTNPGVIDTAERDLHRTDPTVLPPSNTHTVWANLETRPDTFEWRSQTVIKRTEASTPTIQSNFKDPLGTGFEASEDTLPRGPPAAAESLAGPVELPGVLDATPYQTNTSDILSDAANLLANGVPGAVCAPSAEPLNAETARIAADNASSETVACLDGMRLVEEDLSALQGQLIYLEVGGANGVTYNGPVQLEGLQIDPFRAPGNLAGQEARILALALDSLAETFRGTGVIFTLDRPSSSTDFSTVYIGGDDADFEDFGSFAGLAERVDIGNLHRDDNAFVFSDNLLVATGDLQQHTTRLADLVSHEVGHLLGYAHTYESGDGPLDAVAKLYEFVGFPDGDESVGSSATLKFTPDLSGGSAGTLNIQGSGKVTLDFSAYTADLIFEIGKDQVVVKDDNHTKLGTLKFLNASMRIKQLIGGQGDDRFKLVAPEADRFTLFVSKGLLTSATKIDGGLGENTFDVSDSTQSSQTGLTFRVTSLDGFDVKKGSTVEVRTLRVGWIDGTTAADTFTFVDGRKLSGEIQGKGGNDRLDLSAYKNSLTFEINKFDDDPQIEVKADQSTVVGVNDIEELIGGKEADTFAFQEADNPWGGSNYTIDGSAGQDTLDFSHYTTTAVEVNLGAQTIARTGTTKAVKPLNIENVIGGGGNDKLTGDDGANRLDGGPGDDELKGGNGNDTLVGGEDSDTLTPGLGVNTLVFSAGWGKDVYVPADTNPAGTKKDTFQIDAANAKVQIGSKVENSERMFGFRVQSGTDELAGSQSSGVTVNDGTADVQFAKIARIGSVARPVEFTASGLSNPILDFDFSLVDAAADLEFEIGKVTGKNENRIAVNETSKTPFITAVHTKNLTGGRGNNRYRFVSSRSQHGFLTGTLTGGPSDQQAGKKNVLDYSKYKKEAISVNLRTTQVAFTNAAPTVTSVATGVLPKREEWTFTVPESKGAIALARQATTAITDAATLAAALRELFYLSDSNHLTAAVSTADSTKVEVTFSESPPGTADNIKLYAARAVFELSDVDAKKVKTFTIRVGGKQVTATFSPLPTGGQDLATKLAGALTAYAVKASWADGKLTVWQDGNAFAEFADASLKDDANKKITSKVQYIRIIKLESDASNQQLRTCSFESDPFLGPIALRYETASISYQSISGAAGALQYLEGIAGGLTLPGPYVTEQVFQRELGQLLGRNDFTVDQKSSSGSTVWTVTFSEAGPVGFDPAQMTIIPDLKVKRDALSTKTQTISFPGTGRFRLSMQGTLSLTGSKLGVFDFTGSNGNAVATQIKTALDAQGFSTSSVAYSQTAGGLNEWKIVFTSAQSHKIQAESESVSYTPASPRTTPGVVGVDAVWNVSHQARAGAFKLKINLTGLPGNTPPSVITVTTDSIAHDASPNEIKAAIEDALKAKLGQGLLGTGTGKLDIRPVILVSGSGTTASPWRITFGNLGPLTVSVQSATFSGAGSIPALSATGVNQALANGVAKITHVIGTDKNADRIYGVEPPAPPQTLDSLVKFDFATLPATVTAAGLRVDGGFKGLSTGDYVLYVATQTAIKGLTSGSRYFVSVSGTGLNQTVQFFTSRAAAVAGTNPIAIETPTPVAGMHRIWTLHRLNGGKKDDYLVGGDVPNFIEGGSGDDVLIGGSQADVLNGGSGGDTIYGGAGDDLIEGGEGTLLQNTPLSSAPGDNLFAGEGNDQVVGGPGDDYIDPGPGNDNVQAGKGDDTIVVGGEAAGTNDFDILAGGSGSDTYQFYGPFGIAQVAEAKNEGSNDTIDLSGVTGDYIHVLSNGSLYSAPGRLTDGVIVDAASRIALQVDPDSLAGDTASPGQLVTELGLGLYQADTGKSGKTIAADAKAVIQSYGAIPEKGKLTQDLHLILRMDRGAGVRQFQVDILAADTALLTDRAGLLVVVRKAIAGALGITDPDPTARLKSEFGIEVNLVKIASLGSGIPRLSLVKDTLEITLEPSEKDASGKFLPAFLELTAKTAGGVVAPTINYLEQITPSFGANTFLFGNDYWSNHSSAADLFRLLFEQLPLVELLPIERTLEIDTRLLAEAGLPLVIDFRAVNTPLRFELTSRTGLTHDVKLTVHTLLDTSIPGTSIDQGILHYDKIVFTHVGENTTIYTGRYKNDIVLGGSAGLPVDFRGTLIGGEGKAHFLTTPSLSLGSLGTVGGAALPGRLWDQIRETLDYVSKLCENVKGFADKIYAAVENFTNPENQWAQITDTVLGLIWDVYESSLGTIGDTVNFKIEVSNSLRYSSFDLRPVKYFNLEGARTAEYSLAQHAALALANISTGNLLGAVSTVESIVSSVSGLPKLGTGTPGLSGLTQNIDGAVVSGAGINVVRGTDWDPINDVYGALAEAVKGDAKWYQKTWELFKALVASPGTITGSGGDQIEIGVDHESSTPGPHILMAGPARIPTSSTVGCTALRWCLSRRIRWTSPTFSGTSATRYRISSTGPSSRRSTARHRTTRSISPSKAAISTSRSSARRAWPARPTS